MVVLLDGGFSSQLNNYVNKEELLNSPLWCAQYLATNPDAVVKTHSDYISAGCEVITTNTYQASVDGMQKYLGLDHDSSIALIKTAVNLARTAIDHTTNGRSVLLAGSVGPYGACLHDGSEYRGEYIEKMTSEDLMTWHRPRIAALVDCGVDLLAIETIPAVAEATAVLQLLKNEFPKQKAWVSFSCKDEKHISHGETFREAVLQCCQVNREQLVAVGVNCLAPALVSSLLTSVQGLDVPLITYPNCGGSWTPGVGWKNETAFPLTHYLPEWISLGAQYIGGCCSTTANDIKHCRDYIDVHNL